MKTKTFWQSGTMKLGLASILGAWATFFAGELTLQMAITATVAALMGMLIRRGQGVPIAKAVLLCMAVGFLSGCSLFETASDVPDEIFAPHAAARGPRSGESSASTTDTEFPIAPAVAWGASTAESVAVNAGYTPSNTNSGSGHLCTGFVLAANPAILANLKNQLENSAVLRSIADEMVAIGEKEAITPEDEARLDKLRADYAAHVVALNDGAKGLSGDLGNLSHLVVVNIIRAAIGHQERAPSAEEVQSTAKMLPDIISAAKGDATIQEKDEE